MGQIILNFPTRIFVELVQGCTRQCYTCPVSASKKKKILMKEKVFEQFVRQLDSRVKRVDFIMHGEPLLHPDIIVYTKKLKDTFPNVQIAIVSNGEPLWAIHQSLWPLLNLFRAGLSRIQVDVYSVKSKNKFIELIHKNKKVLQAMNIQAIRFIPGGPSIFQYDKGKKKYILLCDDSMGFNKIDNLRTRNVHTWGGNLPYKRWEYYGIKLEQFPMYKKCTEPVKSIALDVYGNSVLCCSDFGKSVDYGNIFNFTIEKLWNIEKLNKVRYALSQGRRDVIPACFFCSRPSYRVGLWPYVGPQFNMDKLKKEFFEQSYISSTLQDLFDRSGYENILS